VPFLPRRFSKKQLKALDSLLEALAAKACANR
jgi:hypothetical protein